MQLTKVPLFWYLARPKPASFYTWSLYTWLWFYWCIQVFYIGSKVDDEVSPRGALRVTDGVGVSHRCL